MLCQTLYLGNHSPYPQVVLADLARLSIPWRMVSQERADLPGDEALFTMLVNLTKSVTRTRRQVAWKW